MKNETVISADQKIGIRSYLADVWDFRDLLFALVERDIKVRYKQTFLGISWVIIQPLLLTFIFWIIFVRLVQMPTQGLPASLFFLAALIPWSCFSNGISQAAMSLEGNAALITKVYFPRAIIPASVILGTIVDFGIGWILFNLIALYSNYWSWMFILFTPLLLLLQLITVLGIGLILSALNAQYRDVKHITHFLIMVGMWITPVMWSTQRLMESQYANLLKLFLYLNPMAGVIESYRALIAGNYVPFRLLASSYLVAFILLFAGMHFFRWRESKLADSL